MTPVLAMFIAYERNLAGPYTAVILMAVLTAVAATVAFITELRK